MDDFGCDDMTDCSADSMHQDATQAEEDMRATTQAEENMTTTDMEVESTSSNHVDEYEVQEDTPKLSFTIPPSQPLTSSEKISVEFFQLAQQYNLSRNAQAAFIDFFNQCIHSYQRTYIRLNRFEYCSTHTHIFLSACPQLLSVYKTKEVIKREFPAKPKRFAMCPNKCGIFMHNEETHCPTCKTPRNDINGKPFATMQYLPLADQLAVLLGRSSTREKLNYRLQRETPADGVMIDYFDGEIWKTRQKQLFTNPYDIALMLFVDGFKVFSMSNISLTMVHAVVLNMSPSERYNG